MNNMSNVIYFNIDHFVLYLYQHCGIMFSDRASVCPSIIHPHPSVNTNFTWCVISLTGWISVKLSTNIYYVSGHCWKGFQDQRSEVVMNIPVTIKAFRWCGIEAEDFEERVVTVLYCTLKQL